jgi:hypothetical protein
VVNKEDHHVPQSNGRCTPPRRTKPSCDPSRHPLWVTLPVSQREQILGALCRLVAQQLAKKPGNKEVTHERS